MSRNIKNLKNQKILLNIDYHGELYAIKIARIVQEEVLVNPYFHSDTAIQLQPIFAQWIQNTCDTNFIF